MRNTKIRILSFILAAAMLTGCGASAESDSMTESSQNDSSSVDSYTDSESKTDTTDDSKSDSSSDESKSEKATTTTKTSESKNESEKAVTTTKQSSTTTSAVATQPVATRPTAKPIVTTKATQKPIVTAKQTTKATTKATSKQTADPTANMSPFMKAMYRVWTGKETQNDIETIRQEYLNYGKSLKPKFKLDKSICLWIGKDGKPTNNCSNGVKGFVTGVASKGSNWIGKVYNCTHQEILNDIAYMDTRIRERIYDNLMYVDVQDETEIRWYFHIEKRTDLYGDYDCFTVLTI